MSVIEAHGLTKVFRTAARRPGVAGALRHLVRPQYIEHTAVAGVDLTIERGESVAYVGPNGAGKSTTIKMLSGILIPTSGELFVNGLVPYRQRMENARRIGVVFGQRTQLWTELPLRESYEALRHIYEMPADRYQANMSRFQDLLGIGELLDIPVRQLSLGQRMRADIAASFLHDPEVVFLDEPTIGLDLEVKERAREFIRKLNVEHGTTVILTTHDLGDIEQLCSRIVLIDNGVIAYDGSLQALKDRYARQRRIHFHAREEVPIDRIRDSIPNGVIEPIDAYRFAVGFDRVTVSAGEVAASVLSQIELVDLRIDEPAIEQVIRLVYNGGLTEASDRR